MVVHRYDFTCELSNVLTFDILAPFPSTNEQTLHVGGKAAFVAPQKFPSANSFLVSPKVCRMFQY